MQDANATLKRDNQSSKAKKEMGYELQHLHVSTSSASQQYTHEC
jgi:hypothetical protein